MSKHEYYDMIVAKAENAELSVLLRVNGGVWREYECGGFPAFSNGDYFLCLPKHKEAVLHGLNGGDYQVKCLNDFSECWYLDPKDWRSKNIWYMLESHESRIKPRKEKRYLYVSKEGATTYAKKTKEEAAREVSIMGGSFDVWKLHELEVEV